jgi:hypothetical protein
MESRSSQPTNIIRFPGARSSANHRRDQRTLMDAVYAAMEAGAIPGRGAPLDGPARFDLRLGDGAGGGRIHGGGCIAGCKE